MKILSIDVGMKNLAYCLLSVDDTSHFNICKWDVVNLCEEKKETCCFIKKNTQCGKPAKFMKDHVTYCNRHAKGQTLKVPTSELNMDKIKKKKITDLLTLADVYDISYKKPIKKTELVALFNDELSKNYLDRITPIKASDLDLLTIGRNMQKRFDTIFKDDKINVVIIENQISTLANRMKTVQGMIAQYFIMKNIEKIEFISAANKLKGFVDKKRTTYNERKKLGIMVSAKILTQNIQFNNWIQSLDNNSKKDDLADSFLQAMWYLREYGHINIKYNNDKVA
jgi:hypothetical protein